MNEIETQHADSEFVDRCIANVHAARKNIIAKFEF